MTAIAQNHFNIGKRIYIKDIDEFAYTQRSLLGISESAVCLVDNFQRRGYIGIKAKEAIVDPESKVNALDEEVEVPTDFRVIGINILDDFGISKEKQGTMFTIFMTSFTKEERKHYIDMFDSLDKSDNAAITQFVNNMSRLLQ